MADVTFSIELNEVTLQKVMENATKTLDKVLQNKMRRIIRRLAKEVGKPAAEGTYGRAVKVTTERTNKGYKIVAEGEAVCFLEFGAGTMAASNHPFAQNVPFDVRPGSWSQTHGSGQFAPGEHEYWEFGGRIYRYVEPRPGLYMAYRAITENVLRIAEEELVGMKFLPTEGLVE